MVEALLQKVKRGAIKNLYIPMPSNCVEDNDAKKPTCLWVENCPSCGSRLQPLWEGRITSCKHVYHDWCAHVHLTKTPRASPHHVVKKCMRRGVRPLAITNLESSPHLHLKKDLSCQGHHFRIRKVCPNYMQYGVFRVF
jgi:hypothetical protein